MLFLLEKMKKNEKNLIFFRKFVILSVLIVAARGEEDSHPLLQYDYWVKTL